MDLLIDFDEIGNRDVNFLHKSTDSVLILTNHEHENFGGIIDAK